MRRWSRTFRSPLRTAKGLWERRQGLYLKRGTGAGFRYAEVAPLPAFGTETFEEALAVARAIGQGRAGAVEQAGPALRWGLSCLSAPIPEAPRERTVTTAALLGSVAECSTTALNEALRAGYRVLKLKIGVGVGHEERSLLGALARQLPSGVQLRLDANAGLAPTEAEAWFQAASGLPVEYLEQPLAPGDEAVMAELSSDAGVRVALDESVAQLPELSRLAGACPQAVFVVKPGLLGDLPGFLRWREAHREVTLVYSSAFESGLGQMVTRHLAAIDAGRTLAGGLGIEHLFEPDAFGLCPDGPDLRLKSLERLAERFWMAAEAA